jgi:8-oxo-dGTP diphosphatase
VTTTSIHIVVGVVTCREKILLAKRPDEVFQGGLWELPGGKINYNEDPYTTLIRELNEEVGLVVQKARPLIRFNYDYSDQSLLIDVWRVYDWEGQAYGRENQVIKWVSITELKEIPMPAANEVILNAIRLPSLYLICPALTGSIKNYLEIMETCLKAGVRLLQLRCGDETIETHPELIYQALDLCNYYDSKLLLNSAPKQASSYKVHGVHLSSSRLLQLEERPLNDNYYVAASCHNLNELNHACQIDVDFVVLSPVEQTKSHPDTEPLGWDNFSKLAENITVPIFALGGMQPQHITTAWNHGAQGLAIQNYIWTALNPAKAVTECMKN